MLKPRCVDGDALKPAAGADVTSKLYALRKQRDTAYILKQLDMERA